MRLPPSVRGQERAETIANGCAMRSATLSRGAISGRPARCSRHFSSMSGRMTRAGESCFSEVSNRSGINGITLTKLAAIFGQSRLYDITEMRIGALHGFAANACVLIRGQSFAQTGSCGGHAAPNL